MIDLTALKWILSAPRRNQNPLQSLPFPACGPLLSMISFGLKSAPTQDHDKTIRVPDSVRCQQSGTRQSRWLVLP